VTLDVPQGEQIEDKGKGDRVNKKRGYKRNRFAIQSLLAIGGGAYGVLKTACRKLRAGGSSQDLVNYIGTYDGNPTEGYNFQVPFSAISFNIFGEEKYIVHGIEDVYCSIKVNYNASPGSIFKEGGVKTKIASIAGMTQIFEMIYNSWTLTESSGLTFPEVWSVASRPKLGEIEKFAIKARSHQPCGRAISVASGMEQLLGMPVWDPLMRACENNFKSFHSPICIGINKYGHDWVSIGKKLAGHDLIYVGDWSKFDQSVPRFLILHALRVIEAALNLKHDPTRRYWANYKRYFIDNIIDKTYMIDKRYIRQVHSGIPSGSLWTSLIDSIINYIVIKEILLDMKVCGATIYVYGDDHIVAVTHASDRLLKKFKGSFIKRAKKFFGMKASSDDCYVTKGSTVCVGYRRPLYPPGDYLSGGTRFFKACRIRI
jgi:hypothetical protein